MILVGPTIGINRDATDTIREDIYPANCFNFHRINLIKAHNWWKISEDWMILSSFMLAMGRLINLYIVCIIFIGRNTKGALLNLVLIFDISIFCL